MTYNYRVIVDVDVNASGTKTGVNQNEQYLRKIEQQVKDSQKRIIDSEAQYARSRYDNKVADYNRQLAKTREFAQAEIEHETRKNQTIASQNRSFHQERFNQQKQAFEREQNLRKQSVDNALAYEKLGQQRIREQRAQTASMNAQILARDPFQSLGNRQKSAFQAGTALRLDEDARFKADILKNDPFQNAKNLNFEQTRQELARLDAATERSSQKMGMWGQAFKGAFIGAVAGLTFSLLISSITGLISKTAELGVNAVKMAADFEATRNAMSLFEGSAARADIQLAKLAQTAYETPALTLEDAQVGATRLRALGFEAETTLNIVQGLAKQKLISGVTDEGAVQRVIVNLQQLRAGSPQIQKDIQQMILSLPSLSVQINKTFGSLTKFKAALREDSEAALNKFAKGLADTKAPTGGLNVAIENLVDTFTLAGREFGTPILDPLSESFIGLTQLVRQNQSVFQEWGQTVGDIISGFNDTKTPTGVTRIGSKILRGYTATISFGLSELLYQSVTNIGEFYRRKGEERRKANPFDRQLQELNLNKDFLNRPIASGELLKLSRGLMATSGVDVRDTMSSPSISTFESRLQQAVNARSAKDNEFEGNARLDKIEREKEQARQNELARIDAQYSQIRNIRENAFQLEVAQNQNNAEKVFQITDRNYSQQIKDAQAFFDKKIALADGDQLEIYKLTVESNNTIRDLENKQAVERLNFEREQNEKRRQNLIEYKELAIREVQKTYADRIDVIQRGIDAERIATQKGYAEIADLTQREANIEASLLRDKYDLQLQDTSLNAQERLNIEKEMFLELESLTKQTYDRLLELNEKRFNRQTELVKREADQMQALLNAVGQGLQAVQSAFEFGQGFMGGINGKDFIEGFGETGKQILLANTAYEKQALIFKERQEVERVGLQNQIALNNQLLTLERDRAEEYDRIALNNVNIRRENALLLATRARNEGRTEDADQYGKTAAELQAQALTIQDRLNKKTSTSPAIVNLENSNQILTTQEKQLKTTQAIEKAEFERARNLGVIAENTEAILSGQKDALYLEERQLSVAKEREALADSIKRLEQDIQGGDTNADLRIRADVLQHIIDLRNEETDAVARTMKAQLDFDRQFTYSAARADASLAEFLANQKGITEILSDARINAISTAYDGLDQVAKSLAKNFGIASKAVEDLISSLLKLGLNYIFRKVFGFGGGSGASQGGGGGILGGLGSFGNFRSFGATAPNAASGGSFNPQSFAQIFGGGGGFGGTPSYNPFAGDAVRNFTGGNLAAGTAPPLSSGANFGGTGLSAIGGLGQVAGFGLTGALLGSQLGRGSIGGGILGGLGGLLGGGIGAAALMPSLFGVGTAAGSSPFAAAAFGFLTNPFTIAAAGALLVGAYFVGRSAARRRDEKTRNQAMIDAFRQIDELITKVNNDQIDGASALQSAEQIRESYMQAMSQLKTKKTRDIALKDVSRIDAKIATLKAAIANQTLRKERLEQSVPTFADGGNLSSFAATNYKNNPLGYQTGGQQFGYFPNAGMVASYNERGSEYILDAETTRNLGVQNLDRLRMTKGRDLNLRQRMAIPQRYEGGSVAPNVNTAPSSSNSSGEPSFVITNHITLGVEDLINTIIEVISANDGSRKQISNLTSSLKNGGNSELVQTIMNIAREKGLVK